MYVCRRDKGAARWCLLCFLLYEYVFIIILRTSSRKSPGTGHDGDLVRHRYKYYSYQVHIILHLYADYIYIYCCYNVRSTCLAEKASKRQDDHEAIFRRNTPSLRPTCGASKLASVLVTTRLFLYSTSSGVGSRFSTCRPSHGYCPARRSHHSPRSWISVSFIIV